MPTFSPASIAMGRTLIPWVLASTACYGLATTLLTIFWRHTSPQNRLFALAHSGGGTTAGWLVWMIWLIGPGYVALLVGVLSPRLMGLSQIDLGTGLGLGALFAALSVGVLLSAAMTYRRTCNTGGCRGRGFSGQATERGWSGVEPLFGIGRTVGLHADCDPAVQAESSQDGTLNND